jgi:hypothetical protein
MRLCSLRSIKKNFYLTYDDATAVKEYDLRSLLPRDSTSVNVCVAIALNALLKIFKSPAALSFNT